MKCDYGNAEKDKEKVNIDDVRSMHNDAKRARKLKVRKHKECHNGK